jgi:hypothetical protein
VRFVGLIGVAFLLGGCGGPRHTTESNLKLLAVAEGRKGRHEEIWATIEGQLQGPQRYIRPGIKGGVGGYGHLGVLAVQLVVKRVYGIEIKQTPTYDYGEMVGPHL